MAEALPNEIWLSVFDYISFYDALQVRLVCNRFCDLISTSAVMKRGKISINRITIDDILDRVQNGTDRVKFQNIELYYLPDSLKLEKIMDIIAPQVLTLDVKYESAVSIYDGKLRNLKSIVFFAILPENTNQVNLLKFEKLEAFECDSLNILAEATLLPQLVNASTQTGIKLKRLTFKFIPDNGLICQQVMSTYANTLEDMEIYFCETPKNSREFCKPFEKMVKLHTLKLSGNCKHNILLSILHSIPTSTALVHVEFTGVVEVDDTVMTLCATKWRNSLNVIHLMFCGKLTDEMFDSFKLAKNNLKKVSISYSRKLSSRGLLSGLAYEYNDTLQELLLRDMTDFDENSLCLIAANLPNLRKLKLSGCGAGVTDTSVAAIFKHIINLEEFNIDGCSRVSNRGLCGFGETPYPISRLKKLNILNISGLTKISDRVLTNCFLFPELKTLVINKCSGLTTNGFTQLIAKCPALEVLSTSGCANVNDDAVAIFAKGLRRLRHLNLSSCPITNLAIYHICDYCENIKELITYDVRTINYDVAYKYIMEHKSVLMKIAPTQ